MSTNASLQNEPPGRTLMWRVDQVCDRFESAWKNAVGCGGQPPRVDDYLGAVPEEVLSTLRRELEGLAVDYQPLYRPEPTGIATATATYPQQAPASPSRITVDIPGLELKEELGRGGMGIVYRARQLNLNRDVAVKVLPPILAKDPARLERFRNEAAVVASLVDSHVLPVYDIQEVQGVPILLMPLIEGADLGKIVHDRQAVRRAEPQAVAGSSRVVARSPDHATERMPGSGAPAKTGKPHRWAQLPDREYLAHVLPLLDQLVEAVTVIHQAGVLHRDIKPSNVLIDSRGNLWLSDFGLARLKEKGLGTSPGEALGTPGFMSPEQSEGAEDIDFRADVFSVGATLYRVLTLEMPYGLRGEKGTQGPPVQPSRLQPALSPDFDAVLLKALEQDRELRYPSAKEFQEDWRRARQGLLPRARSMGRVRRWARSIRRHKVQVGAGLLMAILLASVGYFLSQPTRRPPDPSTDPVVRTVQLETRPSGARVVMVPIHPKTGEFLPGQAIRPEGTTPVTIENVPAGEYLVVAAIEGRGFHEVYRTVPEIGRKPEGRSPSIHWQEEPDGSVTLPYLRILDGKEVTNGMVRFDGGAFTMGSDTLPDFMHRPHQQVVPAFYLDQTEVSVKKFKTVLTPPAEPGNKPVPEDYAVCVNFHEALAYAEEIGKRLPDEAEYEYAATNKGRDRFPWSKNGPQQITEWKFGPVGEPAFDRTDTDPPVFGLFSNVAEWTTSWHVPYPGADRDMLAKFYELPGQWDILKKNRIVRGGPWNVVDDKLAQPLNIDDEWVPRYRHSVDMNARHRGLGFRCARSEKPRFLDAPKAD